eukprot:359699-Chlamydomonas_euryale.AAC.2
MSRNGKDPSRAKREKVRRATEHYSGPSAQPLFHSIRTIHQPSHPPFPLQAAPAAARIPCRHVGLVHKSVGVALDGRWLAPAGRQLIRVVLQGVSRKQAAGKPCQGKACLLQHATSSVTQQARGQPSQGNDPTSV